MKTVARVTRELLDDPTLSAKSKSTYKMVLMKFIAEHGATPVGGVTRDEIELYLRGLTEMSLRTHHLHQTVIHRLFSYAIEKRYVNTNPASHIKRRKPDASKGEHGTDEVVRYLNKQQLATLFRVSGREKRLDALLWLLYESGARIAEVLALNVQSIDFEKRRFQVVGKGNKKRYCFFGVRAEEALRRYIDHRRESPHDALFTERRHHQRDVRRLPYQAAHRELRAITTNYKLLSGVSFHDLRHTFATERAKIIPLEVLRALLGHEKIQTTLIYQQITSEVAGESAQAAIEQLALLW
jgi:integrase/recombinase XerD